MKCLVIGDLHLTDRPRDAYRFGIFPKIEEWQEKYSPDATIIMGDLCDQKDRHSAQLVNAVVENLSQLTETYILMGNHDYIDPNTPFFKFLNKLEGVLFINRPELIDGLAFIPHCRSQEEFDEACDSFYRGPIDYVFLHNTFEGAISETGKKMSGLKWPTKMYSQYGAFAGDIHRPQKVGNITYVGAPYHVRFGDNFNPRCLLLDKQKVTELTFDAPFKWNLTVTDPDDIRKLEVLREYDQVKVTVQLSREEAVDWKKYRQEVLDACAERELEVYGVNLKVKTVKRKAKDVKQLQDPADIVAAFCKSEGVGSQFKTAGLRIMSDV